MSALFRLKKKLFTYVLLIKTNMLKLSEPMLSTNINVIKNLGLFVVKAFNVRADTYNNKVISYNTYF